MLERVSVLQGSSPILFVAPHGHNGDDINTSTIATYAAKGCQGSYVVNHGWKRHQTVDQRRSKANCNDFNHCMQDVVKEEFLDPINAIMGELLEQYENVLIVLVHGMSNDVKKVAKSKNLGAVVGFGDGTPPKLTADPWVKDAFIDYMNANLCETWEGAPGGPYSARGKNNMVQVLRMPGVHCLQVEIVNELRDQMHDAVTTGAILGTVASATMTADDSYKRSPNVIIRSI